MILNEEGQMGIRKDIENKSERFIEQMDLEEEMENLSKLFIDNFMIKGEITEALQEILKKAPDSLIDLIWENTMPQETTVSADREQKEEILYENILDYFKERFLYIEPDELKLLIRIMNNQPISMMETTIVYERFSPKGWLFVFVENDNCIFIVPNEIKEIIRTIEEEDVKKKYAFIFAFRYIVNVCLGLYGVCKKEQIRNVYKEILSIDETDSEMELFEQYFDKILCALEEQGELWTDEGYIISNYLDNKKEYHSILKMQGKDYYLPGPGDIIVDSYGCGHYVEKNREYDVVVKLLSKEIRDVEEAEEMIEEISGYVIREDWEIPQVFNCL